MLKTAGLVLTEEVLTKEEGPKPVFTEEEGFETAVLGPSTHFHEDLESDDTIPLAWKRQKVKEDDQHSLLSVQPPPLVQPRSPSMSPRYSPPPWTPRFSVQHPEGGDSYKSPSPHFQISRSPSPQNETERSSPQKETESSPVHEAAAASPQNTTGLQKKSPEESQPVGQNSLDVDNILDKYMDNV